MLGHTVGLDPGQPQWLLGWTVQGVQEVSGSGAEPQIKEDWGTRSGILGRGRLGEGGHRRKMDRPVKDAVECAVAAKRSSQALILLNKVGVGRKDRS